MHEKAQVAISPIGTVRQSFLDPEPRYQLFKVIFSASDNSVVYIILQENLKIRKIGSCEGTRYTDSS